MMVRSTLALLATSMVVLTACSSQDDSCEGTERRVCLVPLGRVSDDLVEHLVDHYLDEYGLEVRVLDNKSIPTDLVDPDRRQIGGIALIEYMGTLFPEAYADPEAVLVGLTPVDLYLETRDWRFAFGTWGTAENPKGVVSSFRMDPENYGEPPDGELLLTRVRKMVTRYVGLLYYRMPTTSDPRSLLYDNILSLRDLDGMEELLPVPASR